MGVKLRFEMPGDSEPGYLLRQRKAREFLEILDSDNSTDALDGLIDFLVPMIKNGKESVEPAKAREYLLNASWIEFSMMLLALMGRVKPIEKDGAENPT